MLLPKFFKNEIKSLISGSIAQLSNIVFPFACVAEIIAFSVAPTDIEGNFILLPVNPFLAEAYI